MYSFYKYNYLQWQCKADLPKKYRLGAIDVVCEGYDYPEDPYILKGSCGVSVTDSKIIINLIDTF